MAIQMVRDVLSKELALQFFFKQTLIDKNSGEAKKKFNQTKIYLYMQGE